MSKQYGFYYDAGRCIQCRTCEVACKGTRGLESGVKWRQVVETWDGEYPDVTRTFFSLACMHCDKPACAAVCPTGAIVKRVEDGIVVVDRDKCNGCQDCLPACPYGVPQFGTDGITQAGFLPVSIQKSHFCMIPSAPNWGTPYGQAGKQSWQPLHLSRSTTTMPSSARFTIAPVGHAAAQAGLSQCIHAREKNVRVTSGYSPFQFSTTRRHFTPSSTPRVPLQASSQVRH